MTSTNINVGLLESRSSSKVLKPPGGGHSDIFGSNNIKEQPRTRNHQKSSISEIFNAPPSSPEKHVVEIQPPAMKEIDKTDSEAKVVQTPQRTRVPPGGFSSGLW